MNPQNPSEAPAQPQAPEATPLPSEPAPASQPIVPPQPVPAAPMPPQPLQMPAKKSKMRWLIFVGVGLIVAFLAIIGLIKLDQHATKQAGVKKAQEFVASLKNSDNDAIITEITTMMGVEPDASDTSDPKVLKTLGAVTQAGQVSHLLKSADAKLYESSMATTLPYDSSGLDTVVTARFSIDDSTSGGTYYYIVKTARKGDAWRLYSLELSTQKPQ